MESPEGQAAYRALLDEKSQKVDFLRSLAAGHDARVHIRPVFELTEDQKQDIYPDELDSVDVGVELARTVLFCPPAYAAALMSDHQNQDDPIVVAMRRFMADRAH